MAETTPRLTKSAFRGSHVLPRHLYSRSTSSISTSILNNKTSGNNAYRHSISTQHYQANLNNSIPLGKPPIPIRIVLSTPTLNNCTSGSSTIGSSKCGQANIFINKIHPNLTRVNTTQNLPIQRCVSIPPSSPRVVHFKENLPENPPPYDQHIFSINIDESSEPLECPDVLVTGSPRKEKKRSLRSRLLRHITGKKVAAQAARRTYRMTTGSVKKKNPPSSPTVGKRESLVKQDSSSNKIVLPSSSHLTIPIPNDGNFINIHNVSQFSSIIPQNGFIINGNPIDEVTKSFSQLSSNHVILLKTVPEECGESFAISGVNEPLPTIAKPTLSTTSTSSDALSSQSASQSSNSSSHESSVFIHAHQSSHCSSSSTSKSGADSSPQHGKTQNYPTERFQDIKVPLTSSSDTSCSHYGNEVSNDKSHENPPEYLPYIKHDFLKSPHNMHSNMNNNACNSSGDIGKPRVQIDQRSNAKSFTINLKPGMYKLNLNFANRNKASQSQTININVPPDDAKQRSKFFASGRPPAAPEPLYYENARVPFPQRFVHMLKPGLGSNRNHTKSIPKVTIIQQNSNNNGSSTITILSPDEQHIQSISSPRDRVKRRGVCPSRPTKDRNRWAPFSCVHMSSSGIEETLSEASGCDSWQGYEGVEHLKRQLKSHQIVPSDSYPSDLKSCDQCFLEKSGISRYFSDVIKSDYKDEKHIVCDQLPDNNVWMKNSTVFDEKHIVSDQLLPENVWMKNSTVFESTLNEKDCLPLAMIYPKLQKNWDANEVFLKQIVDEYFMDPMSSSDCNDSNCTDDDTIGSYSAEDEDFKIDTTMIDSNVTVQKSEESCVKSFDFCDSNTYNDISLDESYFCDADDAKSSSFTDESLGYDGDIDEFDGRKMTPRLGNDPIKSCSFVNSKMDLDQKNKLENNAAQYFPNHVINSPPICLVNEAQLADGTIATSVNNVTRDGKLQLRVPSASTVGNGTEKCCSRAGAATLSGDIGVAASDAHDDAGGVVRTGTLLNNHQCNPACCGVECASTPTALNNCVSRPLSDRGSFSNVINLGIRKVKPLKLQKFADAVSLSNSTNSCVTDSGESLCSTCRNAFGNKSEYSKSQYDQDSSIVQQFSLDNNSVAHEAIINSLIFERSSASLAPPKFDLEAALKNIQQLAITDDSASQTTLSDSVFENDESFQCDEYSPDECTDYNVRTTEFFEYSPDECTDYNVRTTELFEYSPDECTDYNVRTTESKLFYNSKFSNIDDAGDDSPCNLSHSANADMDKFNVGNMPSPRMRIRRPHKTSSYTIIDDNKYESFDFSGYQPKAVSSSNNNINKPPTIKPHNSGIVRFSASSNEEDQLQDLTSGKPGRKRFARAFQRAAIQVPVSSPQTSPLIQSVENIRSELVIDPLNKRATTVSLEQEPVETCISEYKIGNPPPSLSTKSTQFLPKGSNGENFCFEKNVQKSKKSKKTSPRKYFSGILDAIGNAAPLFRNSIASNCSTDDRECTSDSPCTPPLTPKNVSSFPSCNWDRLSSPCSPSNYIQNSSQIFHKTTISQDIPLYSNSNSGADSRTDASNSSDSQTLWRAAYLGHVGCDAQAAMPNFDASGIPMSTNNECNITNNIHQEKKNADSKLNNTQCSLQEMDNMYENVVFHKDLKKVCKIEKLIVENEPTDIEECKNVTTTATITLNSANFNTAKNNKFKSTINSIAKERSSPATPSVDNSCTVTASFSLTDLHYEDWCSAIGDSDDVNDESGNECGFDRRSESSGSVHSEASSFYYTAGANTIYDAVKKVRKSFADEFADSEIDANSNYDSSDEVTYNLSLNEKSLCTDDELSKQRDVCDNCSPVSSTGSDLMDQLNELHEKYFGKPPTISNDKPKFSNCSKRSDPVSEESNTSSEFSGDFIVHAMPCVVLTDHDSSDSNCRQLPPSRSPLQTSRTGRKGKSRHKTVKSKNSRPRHYVNVDYDSEVSEEVDKRISGIWTTGTGRDADEESCGENDESIDYGSTFYAFKEDVVENHPTNEHNLKHFQNNSQSSSSSKGFDDISCIVTETPDKLNLHSSYNECDCNKGAINNCDSYQNLKYYQRNNMPSFNDQLPSYCNFADVSTLPEFDVGSDDILDLSTEEINEERCESIFEIDDDQSLSYKTNDFDNIILGGTSNDLLSKSRLKLLDISENVKDWSQPSKDPNPDYANQSSLLDDVITCLAGKWKHSSSAPPSPGSVTPRISVSSTPDDKPTQSCSNRSSRTGKPPVSPGTRPRESAVNKSTSSRSQSRLRSRSVSAGAKLRGTTNRVVARPASLVGLPRPSSLTDMASGVPSYSSSQESLHSVSLMLSFDDLAPHPQW